MRQENAGHNTRYNQRTGAGATHDRTIKKSLATHKRNGPVSLPDQKQLKTFPLTRTISNLTCELLQGQTSWVCLDPVQQAVTTVFGCLFEWYVLWITTLILSFHVRGKICFNVFFSIF